METKVYLLSYYGKDKERKTSIFDSLIEARKYITEQVQENNERELEIVTQGKNLFIHALTSSNKLRVYFIQPIETLSRGGQ